MKRLNMQSNTFLFDIHTRLGNLFIMFRDKVCEECGWSIPTFYRKARHDQKYISNAEREKIMKVEKLCLMQMVAMSGFQLQEFRPLIGSLPSSWEENLLDKIHRRFSKLQTYFKERVCVECNYSLPSYYRRVRGLLPLSKAEKEKIKNLEKESLEKLMGEGGMSQADLAGDVA